MAKIQTDDKTQTNSKIVFNEKIDSAITGIALSLAFIITAIFLYIKQDYFIIPAISHILSIICGFIGSMGFSIEIDSISNKPKGLGEIIGGGICAFIWYYLYAHIVVEQWYFRIVFNSLGIVFLFLGLYLGLGGVFKILFSIVEAIKNSPKTDKKSIFSNIVVMISRILGLILTAMNILNFFGIFKNT